MRPRVFMGSSGKARDVCRAVQQELDRDFDVTIWDQGVFRLTYDTIDSLRSELDASDAGIFVLTPDDRGRHVKEVRLVVFDGDAAKITPESMHGILSRVTSP